MSCSTQAGRARRAGLAIGLTRLSSQASYTGGVLLERATQALDRIGPAGVPVAALALRILEPTGPQAARKRSVAGRLAGTALVVGARLAQATPLLAQVKLTTRLSQRISGKIGAAAATLSETGPAGSVTTERRRLFFFKSKQTIELHRSGLTNWLNRQNVIGPRAVTASQGALFTTGGHTWHRGTITFDVGKTRRTITHLQRLSYPADHYYFEGRLSDQQAVAVARGQRKPETMPGFAGRLSPAETLCPAWAGAKRALILANLHWNED